MEPLGRDRRWWALAFIGTSLLVISLNNSILNVALPSISRTLGASTADLQWILDAYTLVFAALLLTMGSINDRIGRKRGLQVGLTIFGVASLVASFSSTTQMLIVSRALLGIGSAMIMPSTLSLVTATFRDPQERAQAIAIWAAIFALGIGVGPVLGGLLLQQFEWNAVFLSNLPVVVIALVGGYFFIVESKDEHAPKPDIPGVLLSVTGLFALVFGFIRAGIEGWAATEVVLAFVIAFVLLLAFAIWERRTAQPMLPLGFFRNMSFTAANAALVMVSFSLFGSLFFMGQYFQSVKGMTALEAGVRLLPMALTLTAAAAFSSTVSHHLRTKLTVGIGILLAATGMFILSQVATVDAPYTTVLLGLLVLAAGMGTATSPATNSVMGSVPVNRAGVGSAMNDTTRQIGGALGVAVLGTFMNTIYLDHLQSTSVIDSLPAQALNGIRNSIQGAHLVAAQINTPQLSSIIVQTADQAFVSGMTTAMLIAAGIMLGAAILTFLFLPSEVQPSSPAHTAEVAGVAGGHRIRRVH